MIGAEASAIQISGGPYISPALQAAEYLEPHWYVAQTCSRHEKRVAEQLDRRGIENFLPLYETMRRWKDRRVRLRLPLFAGYIFARFPLIERLRTLEVSGVTRLVGFNGLPAALPDDEMDAMRRGFASHLRTEPHPYLRIGERARIIRGPFQGLEGILVRYKGATRIILSLDLIARSVAAEIEAADIQPSV